MEFTRQNAPISDKKFTSLERMRTNVLEKARERGLEIEGKINNHFDELTHSRPQSHFHSVTR